ncbi:MAG: hypothetical protein AB7G15_16890, partial [Alphaproteobacteria bacterium]
MDRAKRKPQPIAPAVRTAATQESVTMPHDTSLISTVAMAVGLAVVFGVLAKRLRLPPLGGYLIA